MPTTQEMPGKKRFAAGTVKCWRSSELAPVPPCALWGKEMDFSKSVYSWVKGSPLRVTVNVQSDGAGKARNT